MFDFFQRIAAFLMTFFLSIFSFYGIETEKSVKNVILMVGDGMGFNHLAMTEQIRDVSLTINTLPQQGMAMTYSGSDAVTDSAAGATALACGIKTKNGMIGMYREGDTVFREYDSSYPVNITHVCMENGMKTGVITSDNLSGATPGGFTAHTESRNNYSDITSQQLKTGFDLIWGHYDETLTEEQVADAGYVYIDTISEMNRLTGNEKSYGMFTSSVYHTYNKNSYTPTLSQMTEKAIDLLDSENGFFLMVEGAHIDKKSHNEDEEAAAEALEEFDNAVQIALEFALKDKHTLLIVTADHETGGVTLNEDGVYEMTTGSHTDAFVPVRAFGPYEFIAQGEVIENIMIPRRIARALCFEKDSFPREVLVFNGS